MKVPGKEPAEIKVDAITVFLVNSLLFIYFIVLMSDCLEVNWSCYFASAPITGIVSGIPGTGPNAYVFGPR